MRVLTSSALSSAGFPHGFSTREGGVADADFAVLRDPAPLRENQRLLARAVGFDAARLFQTRQVHGVAVELATGDPAAVLEREADALVAEPGSGSTVGVRIADCVPVLVADPVSGRVAAVHAGWRGVVGGVVRAAIAQMTAGVGAGEPSSYVAAIGPCIGGCCFEVGSDVASQIAVATTREVIVREEQGGGKAYVDLRRAVRWQLASLGLDDARIDDVPDATRASCTRCDASLYHSYRRDGDASGRLIAVVAAR